MKIFTTVPTADPLGAGALFAELEGIGYDGAFTFETKHDPFLPLVAAAAQTEKLQLGTAIAIAFARNPMNLANVGYDLQLASKGRFTLGLGSQIRPHITKRYSSTWSRPAARMREMVFAMRAIWESWQQGTPLRFEGDFYRHTLMTPAFDPGPNPFGTPQVHLAGVQPKMIEVAGEVGDGFIAHPFASRRSLEEHVLPALERGLEKSGRERTAFECVAVCLVATGNDEAELATNREVVRKQLAFYGSTPAYRPTLDCHGWGELQPELNRLSKEGAWDAMAGLVTDEMLETIAVTAPRGEIAAAIRDRYAGLVDAVSIENTRNPDERNFGDIVAALKR